MTTYLIIAFLIVFILLLCFCLAIANFSFENFNEIFEKLNKKQNSYGIETLKYVDLINKRYFNAQLKINKCQQYKDHYSTGIIALSEQTMSSDSLASLAIVSHELGHARQDATGTTLKKHWKLRKFGRTLGLLFLPFMLVGSVFSLLYLFSVLQDFWTIILGLTSLGSGFLIFLFALILKYRELQIEQEASSFAIEFLKEILQTDEIKLCKEFLKSARLTYWASLFRTMFGWTFLTKKERMFR